MKIKIVTDNGHALSKELVKKYDIRLFNCPIYFAGKEYLESNTSREVFLRDLKEKRGFPKTSAPGVADLSRIFKDLWQNYQILLVLMSKELTKATYLNIKQAIKDFPETKIRIIDTRQAGLGKDLIVIEIARLVESGKTDSEIFTEAEKIVSRTNSILALPDLEYLYQGGRIGKAKVLIGSLIKIIPLVGFRNQEGIVSPLGKARTIRQANEIMVEQIKRDLKEKNGKFIISMIGEIDNQPASQDLENLLKQNFKNIEIIKGEIGCTATCYMGPKAWGIGYTIM